MIWIIVIGLGTFGVRCACHRRRKQALQMVEHSQYGLAGLPVIVGLGSGEHGENNKSAMVLCLDLDETLIAPQDLVVGRAATRRFNEYWLKHHAPLGDVLIYNTGRSLDAYLKLIRTYGDMLCPNALVTGEGMSVHWFLDGPLREPKEDLEWEAHINQNWDIELVREAMANFKSYNAGMCHPLPADASVGEKYRESIIVETKEDAVYATNTIRKMLSHTGVDAQVFHCGGAKYINYKYWVGAVPARAGKGTALTYILNRLKIGHGNTMVVGDSGNDLSMFKLNDVKGTVVANAQSELVDFYTNLMKSGRNSNFLYSEEKYADAIIDGLKQLCSRNM